MIDAWCGIHRSAGDVVPSWVAPRTAEQGDRDRREENARLIAKALGRKVITMTIDQPIATIIAAALWQSVRLLAH
jgi:hypothetical protein